MKSGSSITPLALASPDGTLRRALATADADGRVFAFDPSQPRDEDGKWTVGGGAVRLEVGDPDAVKAAWAAYAKAPDFTEFPVEDVDLEKVRATQPSLKPANLRVIKGREDLRDDSYSLIAIKVGGLYYLTDGHHRAALKIASGAKTMKMSVWAVPDVKEHSQVDYSAVGKRMDALEAKGLDALRDALSESRDALVTKVRKASDFAALVTDLKRLPRFGAVEMEVRAMLDRAREAGLRDARGEVREGKREFAEWDEAKHPRAPAGTGEGGQWTSGTEGLDALIARARDGVVENGTAQVFRTGTATNTARGFFFGDSEKSVEGYRANHGNAPIERYEVKFSKGLVVDHHYKLYQKLFPNKGTWQDAIFRADKASGFKSSIVAARKVEEAMFREARKQGFDAVLFTAPPAPAKHELAVFDRKQVRAISGAKFAQDEDQVDLAFDPNQPRAPAGTGEGGQWSDGAADQLPTEWRGHPVAYHGSDVTFDVFDPAKMGSRTDPGFFGRGAYLVDDRENAQRWGKHVLRGAVRLENPLRVSGMSDFIAKAGQQKTEGKEAYRAEMNRVTDALIAKGHDGVVYVRSDGKTQYISFFPQRQVKIFADDVRTFADSSFSPKAATRWLRATAFWVAGILGDRVLADVKGIILNGLKTGTAGSVMAEQIFDAFLPWLGDPNVIRDEQQLAPYRLETIVRTNTTTAYNHGRLTEFLDPDIIRFVKGVKYSAILDTRTTEVCRYLDGKVFKVSDSNLEALLPPNHYQCRSIIVPIVAGEQVSEDEFITPAEVGKARELADAKFLTQTPEAWKAYAEWDEG